MTIRRAVDELDGTAAGEGTQCGEFDTGQAVAHDHPLVVLLIHADHDADVRVAEPIVRDHLVAKSWMVS